MARIASTKSASNKPAAASVSAAPAPAPAPVLAAPEPVSASADVGTKKVVRQKKVVAAAPEATLEVVSTDAVAAPVQASTEVSTAAAVADCSSVVVLQERARELAAMSAAAQELTATLSAKVRSFDKLISREMKNMEKAYARDLKLAKKSVKRRRVVSSDTPKKPVGFLKPMPISNELAKFLGLPEDILISRTDATKEIYKYVVANGLQNSERGRKIVPDKKLATLLRLEPGTTFNYIQIQKYLKAHILKASDAPAPAAAASASASA